MMKKGTRKLGKYEVGRTIGEGTFAKVKFARNTETGESVAMKVLAKTSILKHRMVDQIKREISIMKIVRHPNIVRFHEALAGRTKIYIILEFVSGGELFDKILIDAVVHCHSKGVYHRDLKPENLLLDSYGNLKVSDFGLSALPLQWAGLLHTTCGTPNYVAQEVLGNQGYDGSAADVWSCGVILFVIMAGKCSDITVKLLTVPLVNVQINAAQFSCPYWFSPGAKSLIQKILDPNPKTRIQIEGIKKDPRFRKHYVPVRPREEEVNLDDIRAVFDDIEDQYIAEQSVVAEAGPLIMNAFEMIALPQGLNLSALFDRQQVFEVAPSLFMVDVRKAAGDTLEYHKFYKNFCAKLENIIWKPTECLANPSLLRKMTC
ncbi:hypothetical protein CRYUN_Cryun03dG0070300 [Craigia yunnanensis]